MEVPADPHQFGWNLESMFDPNDLFYSESSSTSSINYDCLLGSVTAPYDNFTSDNFLLGQDDLVDPLLRCSKRRRPSDYQEPEQEFYPEFNLGYFNGIAPYPNFPNYIPTPTAPEMALPPLPDFPTGPPAYSYGSFCESSMKKEPTSTSPPAKLSAQSIAARQRRRKITERTQELGKLVPGGHKMNTAEMLQAAYKYIGYLQAQVGLLESMSSYNQLEIDEELHDLLESPLIQEKLYSTENCIVPQKFVQELSSDHQMVKSNPALLPLVEKQVHSCSD
ncbi:transcription factor bHLH53-like [Andrographis paniculata]|uniref:transcription factor bHLH53-like n=1 Tax=Andrographis paniculata TaxID=175694 RepID=UPI0021E826C4|nr:transcription factor bHLH53-like [Andrographis paniculata]